MKWTCSGCEPDAWVGMQPRRGQGGWLSSELRDGLHKRHTKIVALPRHKFIAEPEPSKHIKYGLYNFAIAVLREPNMDYARYIVSKHVFV